MRNIIITGLTVIFISAALSNLITSAHFSGMSSSERLFIIRFLLSIGLFAGSIISLKTFKNWVFALVLAIAALGLLFTIR